MIIFDEKEYFDNLLKNGFKDRISKRDLIILAKNWKSIGKFRDEIYELLVAFCRYWQKGFNEAKYESALLDAIRQADETKTVSTRKEIISFSNRELEIIALLEDEKAQRILFIIMCICKMYNRDNVYFNSTSKIKIEDICQMAKVKTTKNGQGMILHTLVENGLITINPNRLLQFYVTALDSTDDGDKALVFKPNADMIVEYTEWFNKTFYQCARCKKQVRRTNNRCKYCNDCAKQINIEKTILRKKGIANL